MESNHSLIQKRDFGRNITLTGHEVAVIKELCEEHLEVLSSMMKPHEEHMLFTARVATSLLKKLRNA